jgi:hypothetical protein
VDEILSPAVNISVRFQTEISKALSSVPRVAARPFSTLVPSADTHGGVGSGGVGIGIGWAGWVGEGVVQGHAAGGAAGGWAGC